MVKTCKRCNASFVWSRSGQRFYCSRLCADKSAIALTSVRNRGYYYSRPEMRERLKRQTKANHRRIRDACFTAYGGKCVCCGETEYEFLTFEHINGGGAKHRKLVPHTDRWLYKNNFPKDAGITVLCMNCNLAEGRRGGCPHKTATSAYGYCVG